MLMIKDYALSSKGLGQQSSESSVCLDNLFSCRKTWKFPFLFTFHLKEINQALLTCIMPSLGPYVKWSNADGLTVTSFAFYF